MSMPANVESCVWQLLNWNCGLNAGRSAYIPESGVIVNSFKVLSESTQKEHQIKTIMSGAEISPPDNGEEVVLKVLERQEKNGKFVYKTKFASGEIRLLKARDFIDDSGDINAAWLGFAKADDLEAAIASFTESKLKLCPHYVECLFLEHCIGYV